MVKFPVPKIDKPLEELEARRKDATALAFIGDAVHTLAVRSRLVEAVGAKTGVLHRLQSKEVSATAQAATLKRIESELTEVELDVYKRCRNAHQTTMAKNASAVEYKIASGFEGLLGYLYLTGSSERIAELLNKSFELQEQVSQN